jgi:hypothetical protein
LGKVAQWRRSFIISTLSQIVLEWSNQEEEDERRAVPTEETRNSYIILVERGKGKIPLGRYGLKLEEIFKYTRKIGYEDERWIHLARNMEKWRSLVKTATKFGFHRR